MLIAIHSATHYRVMSPPLQRYVRWSASLIALLFLIIVATVDLPGLPQHIHERLYWTLPVREMCFAGGAIVLAGSLW